MDIFIRFNEGEKQELEREINRRVRKLVSEAIGEVMAKNKYLIENKVRKEIYKKKEEMEDSE